jgi:hypothetical protein
VVLFCILRWILRADGRIDEIETGEIAVQSSLYRIIFSWISLRSLEGGDHSSAKGCFLSLQAIAVVRERVFQ